MEQFDREKAKRVWQRVQGTLTPDSVPGHDLQELIVRESQDAAVYLHLSRRIPGRDGAALRQLYEQEQSHAAILRGICALTTGYRPGVSAPQPENGPVEVLLRRCYGREMRCLAQYESRSADPEYGQIFARMAQQEREHCRQILELLGSLHQI